MSVLNPIIDSWDGENRLIYLKSGVTQFHWIEDIYKEYRYWRRTDESSRKWLPMLKADGNIPKGGGKFTPRYLTLLNGTRVVPFNENISITILGEAITDNPDIDPNPFNLTTRTEPIQIYLSPSEAEIILVDGGSNNSPIMNALNVVNEGVKKASKLIPHNDNII